MSTLLTSRFIFLLLALTLSFTCNFSSANNHSCNTTFSCPYDPNIVFRYPFWKSPSEGDYICGVENLKVTCDEKTDRPVISLFGDDFYLTSKSNNSIIVVDTDVEGYCPRVKTSVNQTMTTEFQIDHDTDYFYTFFFNCKNGSFLRDLADSGKINCMDSLSYVIEAPNRSLALSYHSEGICEEHVMVLGKKIAGTFRGNLGDHYAEALRSGFNLTWKLTDDCYRCEGSGGRCGFESSTKMAKCLCNNSIFLINETCPRPSPSEIFSGRKKAVIVSLASVSGFILIASIGACLCKLHRRNRYERASYGSRSISSDPSWKVDAKKASQYFGVHVFSFSELEKATNYFDEKREVGDGGYGAVYYGKLRDGRAVAVKRLYESNYKRTEQFLNEVGILAKLNHRHLVTLYGCTSRHSRELLLVYEYIKNGTVADHLHGHKAKLGALPWHLRLSIAVETADALVYLHASDIIHRDVKTSNILLDENFRVKVGDFGLSRFFPLDATHVSTAPQGTPGYVDPEYHQCYQLTEKSDVYSFGVVLGELISSLPAVDITRHRKDINLSNMVINKIENSELNELVDSTLGFETEDIVRDQITAVSMLAVQCLQSSKEVRPTMEAVLEILKRIQGVEDTMNQTEQVDTPLDVVALLKFGQIPPSPNSVFAKWSSSTTTPASST